MKSKSKCHDDTNTKGNLVSRLIVTITNKQAIKYVPQTGIKCKTRFIKSNIVYKVQDAINW